MHVETVFAFLAFGTIGALAVFDYFSAARTQRLELAAHAPVKAPRGPKPVDT